MLSNNYFTAYGARKHMKSALLATALLLSVALVSSCSRPLSNREKAGLIGAGVGAGGGALIGSAAGSAAAGAAIGGPIGLVTGGLIGDRYFSGE